MMTSNIFNRKNKILLKELVRTDFKLRYQGSILGIAWSVLKPLMLFVVMYLVFVKFLRFTDGTPTFPIVLLLGIALWGFFTEATGVGMQSVVGRGDLLRKISFPKYIIVLSAIINALIGLSINLVVVLIFAIFSGVNFTWLVLFLPLNILQLAILAIGVSLILSTLYVKYRDISHIWEVVLQMMFFAMPIIYPLSLVSDMNLTAAKVILLNPTAQIIQDFRHNLIAPETVPTTWSMVNNPLIASIPVVLTFLFLIIGAVYFYKNSKKFAETM